MGLNIKQEKKKILTVRDLKAGDIAIVLHKDCESSASRYKLIMKTDSISPFAISLINGSTIVNDLWLNYEVELVTDIKQLELK